VTIGLPFLDCARTLERAIRSIFAQAWRDWELLLVDDGSTDGSGAIAAAVRDPRVSLLSDGRRRGLVARLNQIASLARGPYLCRMDGDDLAHPDRLAKQVAWLDAHPEVDALGTLAVAIDGDDRPSRLRGGDPAVLADPGALLRGGGLVHPSVMARTAWARRFPYDPAFVRAEDRELWVRAGPRSTLAQLGEPLLFYRETGPVNLANHRRSCATDRLVLRRYGPERLGRLEIALLLARSHAKEACYRLFSAAGASARLVALRGVPLTPAERAAAEAAIARVLATPVPGLDEAAALSRGARA
jgi:glycosyltransferase involved in cell wall biosynthesis